MSLCTCLDSAVDEYGGWFRRSREVENRKISLSFSSVDVDESNSQGSQGEKRGHMG